MSLSPQQLSKGLVTCSTGNHALAFVWACGVLAPVEATSTIYLPTTASPSKVSRLIEQGAHVVQFGQDCVLAEQEARRVAEQNGQTYISPYNDWEVRAKGAGTGMGAALLQSSTASDCVSRLQMHSTTR